MTDRVEELAESTCLQLLAAGGVGRVAVNGDPAPLVVPVDYVAVDRTILFRTVDGTKWEAARAGDAAAFEVDGIDPLRRSGWSVLLHGRLEAVDDDEAVAELLGDLDPLPGGDRPHVVRMVADGVSGRRIPADAAWTRAHREHHTWTGQDASDLLG
jgi:hypothetical protein